MTWHSYLLKVDEKSVAQGFEESRLPKFTEEEQLEIQGSADFLGFNHYTSNLAYPTPKNEINTAEMGWLVDSDVTDFKDPTWYSAASKWLKVSFLIIKNSKYIFVFNYIFFW